MRIWGISWDFFGFFSDFFRSNLFIFEPKVEKIYMGVFSTHFGNTLFFAIFWLFLQGLLNSFIGRPKPGIKSTKFLGQDKTRRFSISMKQFLFKSWLNT